MPEIYAETSSFRKLKKRYPAIVGVIEKEIEERCVYYSKQNIKFLEKIFDEGRYNQHLVCCKDFIRLIWKDYEPKETKDFTETHIKKFLFLFHKKENPIIKRFFPEKSLSLIYGEPASCKSLFLNYLGICISTQKKFLNNFSAKKLPVLYISTENSLKTDLKRLRAIFKGMNIAPNRRKPENIKFHMLERKETSVLSDNLFLVSLRQIIRKHNIKLILIDTISPLISDIDDNHSSSIVGMFSDVLFPLIDKFGVSIIATMHSQKTGRDFLGSIKLKASCDSLFELKREDNTLSLLCHKNRDGENNLKMNIDFQEKNDELNKVTFTFLEEFSGKKSLNNTPALNKQREVEDFILKMLSEKELKYKEIVEECKNNDYSTSTIGRAINSLYEAKKILKNKGKLGGYYVS